MTRRWHDVNPPDCPAQKGRGTDIIAADFRLAVRDSENGNGEAVTQICGYFAISREREESGAVDALVSAIVEEPAESPAASAARRISADKALTAKVEDELRDNITVCLCWMGSQCPALNAEKLRQALENAPGTPAPGQRARAHPDRGPSPI